MPPETRIGAAFQIPPLVSWGAVANGRRSKLGPAVAGNELFAAARAGVDPGITAATLTASTAVTASRVSHLVLYERDTDSSRPRSRVQGFGAVLSESSPFFERLTVLCTAGGSKNAGSRRAGGWAVRAAGRLER